MGAGDQPRPTSPRCRDKSCRVAWNCLDTSDKLRITCHGSSNKFLFRFHGNFYIFLPRGRQKARLFPNRCLRNVDRAQNQSTCNNHRVESPNLRSPCMVLFRCLDNYHTQPFFLPANNSYSIIALIFSCVLLPPPNSVLSGIWGRWP